MKVGNPDAFWLLLGLVPLLAVALLGYYRGKRDLRRLGGDWQLPEMINLYLVKWFFSTTFLSLFLAFSVLAMADISWGRQPVEEDKRGVDIVCVIDVSRSMLADDVPPSRLERSGSVIRGLLMELSGARYAMVIFKGMGVPVIPLTEDTVAVDSFLDHLSTGMLTSPGTDLEKGLDAALASFPDKMERYQTIVLFSDGESLTGSPMQAALRAAERGIPVYAVAAGIEGGAPLSNADGSPIVDRDGSPVLSVPDRQLLQEISRGSGGKLFQLSDPGTVGQLADEIRRYASESSRVGFRLESILRYRFFLLLAFLSLACFLAIRVVKWKRLF